MIHPLLSPLHPHCPPVHSSGERSHPEHLALTPCLRGRRRDCQGQPLHGCPVKRRRGGPHQSTPTGCWQSPPCWTVLPSLLPLSCSTISDMMKKKKLRYFYNYVKFWWSIYTEGEYSKGHCKKFHSQFLPLSNLSLLYFHPQSLNPPTSFTYYLSYFITFFLTSLLYSFYFTQCSILYYLNHMSYVKTRILIEKKSP